MTTNQLIRVTFIKLESITILRTYICTVVTNSKVILFFQAEDGIRYRNVTGVQTCALPIFGLGDLNLPVSRLHFSATRLFMSNNPVLCAFDVSFKDLNVGFGLVERDSHGPAHIPSRISSLNF